MLWIDTSTPCFKNLILIWYFLSSTVWFLYYISKGLKMDSNKENKSYKESLLGRLWYRLWGQKSKSEKKRLTSFIPLILYTFAFIYGVIYLSILNTVNRDHTGTTVKRGWEKLSSKELIERERNLREIKASFMNMRKQVAGAGYP